MLPPTLLWKTFEVSLKYWASKVILQEFLCSINTVIYLFTLSFNEGYLIYLAKIQNFQLDTNFNF